MTAPMIGDIVHYTSYGTPGGEYQSECRAAIVAGIASDTETPILNLAILNPTGMFFNTVSPGPAAGAPGTWHYKCRGQS